MNADQIFDQNLARAIDNSLIEAAKTKVDNDHYFEDKEETYFNACDDQAARDLKSKAIPVSVVGNNFESKQEFGNDADFDRDIGHATHLSMISNYDEKMKVISPLDICCHVEEMKVAISNSMDSVMAERSSQILELESLYTAAMLNRDSSIEDAEEVEARIRNLNASIQSYEDRRFLLNARRPTTRNAEDIMILNCEIESIGDVLNAAQVEKKKASKIENAHRAQAAHHYFSALKIRGEIHSITHP